MPILTPQTLSPEAPELVRAAQILREGGLVAFATETVYGLGANALDAGAVSRIFALKGRPGHNPLIVHVENVAAAQAVAAHWPEAAAQLAAAFWPGPLTLVLPKRAAVPGAVTAGLDSVALRAPAHPLAQALLRACGLPLAAPSANRYTQLSPTMAAHVAKAFGDSLFILDGGECEVGIESTVLSLDGDAPTLLRPGAITQTAIEAVIGPVLAASKPLQSGAARPSPGMDERHYAPRAQLVLLPASQLDAAALSSQQKTAVLHLRSQPVHGAKSIAMPHSPAVYARRLYALLHELDDGGFDVVIVEEPPPGAEWTGVSDRLTRASK